MLFKNLKTGNLVEAKNPDVIDMMKGSPNYEAITPSATAAPVAAAASTPAPAKKRGGRAKAKE